MQAVTVGPCELTELVFVVERFNLILIFLLLDLFIFTVDTFWLFVSVEGT